MNRKIRDLNGNKKQEAWEKEKEEIESRIKELESRKEQKRELLERLREIERREEARERRERRNNIILKGEELPCGGTLKAKVEQVLVQHLQVKAEIEEAFWIGRGKRGSALIAKLKSWQQKKEVMTNKNKLKNKNIYI